MASKKVVKPTKTDEVKEPAKTKGFSLGCLIGLHAWGKDGYCIYCGKKK